MKESSRSLSSSMCLTSTSEASDEDMAGARKVRRRQRNNVGCCSVFGNAWTLMRYVAQAQVDSTLTVNI